MYEYMVPFHLICTYLSSYKSKHKDIQIFNHSSVGLRILHLG
jgi:hypothetical protein